MGELLPHELNMAKRQHDAPNQEEIPESERMLTKTADFMMTSDQRPDGDTPPPMLEEGRETWGKKIDFLLSVIGFSVDLANIWRFPYLCYKNGGGVFLIPYAIMAVVAGVPLFYMELALGQYYRQGAISTWGKVCPLFKGIGYCVVMSAFYVDFFYNVIISWALRFFYESFTTKLPWESCENYWNGACCYDLTLWNNPGQFNLSYETCFKPHDPQIEKIFEKFFSSNCSNLTSAADEYFNRHFLGFYRDDVDGKEVGYSIENLGPIQWKNLISLALVYLICYFSLWKGIKMSGKVVWFTAVFPYIVLLVLFVRGVTLPGAALGIEYYLKPNWEKLLEGEVWMDAATQVFFSLGPGFGVLLAFASYNPFHNNIYQDALLTSAINCCTSFVSGFVIFSMLGYMSCRSGKPVTEVATEGTGLVFVVYPEALATMPGGPLFAIIFFLMLLTLGLDSSFGGSEAIITALSDEFPVLKEKREIFVAALFSLYFVVGIAMCTRGGYIIEEWIGYYCAKYGLVLAVFIEAIVVSWIYGLHRFKADIKEMLGFEPGKYWCFCWAFFAPAFLAFNFVVGSMGNQFMQIGDVELPLWFNIFGLILAFSSALSIPVMAIYQIYIAPGNTFAEKLKESIVPWKDRLTHEPQYAQVPTANPNSNVVLVAMERTTEDVML